MRRTVILTPLVCNTDTQTYCVVFSGKVIGSRVSTTPGALQRSRSDVDVNAAASVKSRMSSATSPSPFSSAAALPPGSYASLGETRSHTIYLLSLSSLIRNFNKILIKISGFYGCSGPLIKLDAIKLLSDEEQMTGVSHISCHLLSRKGKSSV